MAAELRDGEEDLADVGSLGQRAGAELVAEASKLRGRDDGGGGRAGFDAGKRAQAEQMPSDGDRKRQQIEQRVDRFELAVLKSAPRLERLEKLFDQPALAKCLDRVGSAA